MKRYCVASLIAVLVVATGCVGFGTSDLPIREHQIPNARQGSVVEVLSPVEVMVESYGIYYGEGKSLRARKQDVREHGNERALLDARRSAIHVLLFEGATPLLSRTEERMAFERDKDFFYSPESLGRYITWEESQFTSRLLIEDATGLKISKRFKIHTERLVRDLNARRILASRESLISDVGNPIIMVIPNAESTRSPLDILGDDPTARQASTVIQSHLAAKGFETIVPEQSAEISQLVSTQQNLFGQMDMAYQLALTIGSDIYITFSGYPEDGSFGTTRYVATLNVFESTTGRLLGSETGYGEGRKGELGISVEEALNDAVDKALIRVMDFWKEDVRKGVPYKVVVGLDPGLDAYDVDSLQMALLKAVDSISVSYRELVLTDGTMDLLVRIEPSVYEGSLAVYQALKAAFERQGTQALLVRGSLNRKLLQLRIEY